MYVIGPATGTLCTSDLPKLRSVIGTEDRERAIHRPLHEQVTRGHHRATAERLV